MPRQNRRRQYLTNRGFQYIFAIPFILVCLAGLALNERVFSYLTASRIEEMHWSMSFYEETVLDIIKGYLLYTGLSAAALATVFTSIFSMLFRRRIARSIGAMHEQLSALRDGNLVNEITQRKGLFFKEESEEFNEMAKALRHRYRMLDQGIEEISATVAMLPDVREELLHEKSAAIRARASELLREISAPEDPEE